MARGEKMTPTPEGIISTSDVWVAPVEEVKEELTEQELPEVSDDLSELS